MQENPKIKDAKWQQKMERLHDEVERREKQERESGLASNLAKTFHDSKEVYLLSFSSVADFIVCEIIIVLSFPL